MKLAPVDREFFQIIAQTAFCNPFSEERARFDSQIVGHPVKPLSTSHIQEMSQIVSARIGQLRAQNVTKVQDVAASDRAIMRTAFLFDIFHRFHGKMDQLIVEQRRLGLESAPVPFAGEALGELHDRGFDARESVRLFSIFYQLRRAFHFIVNGLIGPSPCMFEFRRHLWNNVFTHDVGLYEQYLWNRMEDFSTLLLGETGTGKGAAASAIGCSGYIPYDEKQGRFSESFMRSFVSINLSQAPETLIESELFGHRKGAFTGAIEAHEGVLARCSPHGAIFLDEIGDVSVPVQIKLLQVLQERTFCPVGSHEPLRFKGRVIAATNRPLDALRKQSLFRDDFFYRLCSDIIEVPPLRQRLKEDPDELRQLLDHVLTGILGQSAYGLAISLEESLRQNLAPDYPWPGNVRELEQAVRRILLLHAYKGSAKAQPQTVGEQLVDAMEAGQLTAEKLLESYCSLLYEKHGSYEAVSRLTQLDRRTVKKYVTQSGKA